ncbi:MAG TPA: hypothetical protein GX708_10400 [Gallicola sp.]|nr:hypothetical protein [Gallicola sp.]
MENKEKAPKTVIEREYNIDKEIRLLKANEIDCRVNTINEKGITLLLYKDARVDMAILDETYGVGNWQRTHEVINDNLFCNIEVWNDRINQWVKKQDVGVESYSQKEKGQASDSFKRAGFNWGIGRELYTSPFIWIAPRDDKEIFKNNKGALTTYTKFVVKEIGYNKQREINKLVIVDEKGKVRFTTGNKQKSMPVKNTIKKVDEIDYHKLLVNKLIEKSINVQEFAKENKLNAQTPQSVAKQLLEELTKGE